MRPFEVSTQGGRFGYSADVCNSVRGDTEDEKGDEAKKLREIVDVDNGEVPLHSADDSEDPDADEQYAKDIKTYAESLFGALKNLRILNLNIPDL